MNKLSNLQAHPGVPRRRPAVAGIFHLLQTTALCQNSYLRPSRALHLVRREFFRLFSKSIDL